MFFHKVTQSDNNCQDISNSGIAIMIFPLNFSISYLSTKQNIERLKYDQVYTYVHVQQNAQIYIVKTIKSSISTRLTNLGE